MNPKFTEGQRVTNMFLGAQATIGTVWTDGPAPRYDLVYDGSERTYTAAEIVLTADTDAIYTCDAIAATLAALDQMATAAIAARVIGALSRYQLERITDSVRDAKHDLFTRASDPSEYL